MMYIKISFVENTGNYHDEKKSISLQNRYKAESKTLLNVFNPCFHRICSEFSISIQQNRNLKLRYDYLEKRELR